MREQRTVPFFGARRELGTAIRRALFFRVLEVTLPLVGLLAIDLTGRLTVLRPLLLFVPLLDLRRQVVIWIHHIQRFGFPPLAHCRRMLSLDSLRGYDPRSNTVSRSARGHPAEFVTICVAIAAACWVAWLLTDLSAILYPGVFSLMLAVKAVIRRSRPPAVLLLGASGLTTSRFVLRVMKVAAPLNVVSCLHHSTMAPVIDDALLFFSFRASDTSIWQQMVGTLVTISPLVVLDIRQSTLSVEHEIEVSTRSVPRESLFFVGKQPEHPAIPRDRCFGEGELVEALHAALWGTAVPGLVSTVAEKIRRMTRWRSAARGARWIDRRNGYFAWCPPSGWKARPYEDARTKVAFHHPSAPEVFARFIVRQADGASNVPSMTAVQGAEAIGAKCDLSQASLLGVPCKEVRMVLPNQEECELWIFVLGGLQFNIQYSAPAPSTFRAHYDAVRHALKTITVLNEWRRRAGKLRDQRLAGRLRYARLAADTFGAVEARRTLIEARGEFAGDASAVAQIDSLLRELEAALRT